MSQPADGGLQAALRAEMPALDRVARLAQRAVRATIVLVIGVRQGATRVLGQAGLPDAVGRDVPPGSFGARVVASGACSDAGALAGTWEAERLGARAAVGVPVRAADGTVVGAAILLDGAPRAWTPDEVDLANEFAEAAAAELDRLAAHARLRRAESYRALVERSKEPVLVHVDGIIRFANAAAVSLLGGRTPGDLLGRSVDAFLTRPYLKEVEQRLLTPGAADGAPPVWEEQLVRLDGASRYVEIATEAYLRGEAPAVQVFLRDITERRQAREALRAREAQLRLLLERVPALFWTTDEALRMTFWQSAPDPTAPPAGPTVASFFGRSEESIPVLTHRRALAGESAWDILEWRDGEYEVRVEPVRDDDGRVVGTAAVALDTTLRRRAENRARGERELEALGRISGGVAHGVNNALATIVGLASVLAGDPSTAPATRQTLDVILDASARARALTSNLLGFAGEGGYRLERIDLNEVAVEAAAWTRTHGRAVTIELAPALPTVEGDLDQLREAVLNVCRNAVEATVTGASVRITTRREEADTDPRPTPLACLTIRDTGRGMPDAVRERAVEPFFTTKPFGEGSGMGLSMAFGVARHHGGDLRIVSAPGSGTAVTFYLPGTDEVASPARAGGLPPREEAPRAAGRPMALVIDDDEWVLYSSCQLLESLGYGAVPAPDGPTGLRLYEDAQPRFAFVLLDLRMPGMDGEQVLRRLVALDPDVRVVLCTGYERAQVSQRLFALGHVGFLGKPFDRVELEAAVAAVMADPV